MTTTTIDAPPSNLLKSVRNDGICTLTLNRPDAFNALSVALLTDLLAAFRSVAADPQIRVVILSGNGKAFSAGHDLKEMRENSDRDSIRALFELCGQVMMAITALPQPVIARVHGIATAAGCQLVASADLAVAAEEARFAVSGVNLGLFCSTPMVALTRNVPRKVAMEMLLTGEFIDSAAALRHGLVNRVVPRADLDRATEELASVIASKSPAAISIGKKLFYRQLEAGLAAAYDVAANAMTDNMMTCDAQAGIDAFISKRPTPPWTGR